MIPLGLRDHLRRPCAMVAPGVRAGGRSRKVSVLAYGIRGHRLKGRPKPFQTHQCTALPHIPDLTPHNSSPGNAACSLSFPPSSCPGLFFSVFVAPSFVLAGRSRHPVFHWLHPPQILCWRSEKKTTASDLPRHGPAGERRDHDVARRR